MTERARHANLRELPRLADGPFDADHRVQAQQFDRHRRVREIDLPGSQRLDDRQGQRLHIDLQANRQRGDGIDRGDDLVHPQNVRPQLLVAEGIEAEDRLSVAQRLFAVAPGCAAGLLCLCRGRVARGGVGHRED